MLNQIDAPPTSQEWVGLYKSPKDAIFKWVACGGYFREVKYGPVQFSGEFMSIFRKYPIWLQYFTLKEVKLNDNNTEPSMALSGWMTRVWVDRV